MLLSSSRSSSDEQRLDRLARDFDDRDAHVELASRQRRSGLWLRYVDRGLNDNWLRAFLAADEAAGLTALDLSHNDIGVAGIEALVDASSRLSLRELSLDHNPLGAAGLEVLARAGVLGGLTRLSLRGVQKHGPGAFDALLSRDWPALEVLDLGGNPVDDDDLAALAGHPGFPRLRELNLDHSLITDDGIGALVRGCTLPSLVRFDLGGDFIGPVGAAALVAATGPLPRLVRLGLAGTRLAAPALATLAALPALQRLRALDLGHNRFDAEALLALAGSENLRVEFLGLAENPLTAATLARLLDAGGLQRLEALDLASTGLDEDAIDALGRAPQRDQIRSLDLSSNPLGDRGLQSLARTRWPALRRLDLGFVGGSADGFDAVRRAPWLGQLQWLRLEGQSRDVVAVVPALGPTTRVVLGTVRLDAAGLVDLLESPAGAHLEALALFRWGEPQVVRHLPPEARLSVNWEPDGRSFQRLVTSPGLTHVSSLSVHYAGLGAAEIEALVNASTTHALSELDLSHHDGIGAEQARRLAAWPGLARLERLALSYTDIGNRGIVALANSRLPTRLARLELGFTGADDAAVIALCGAAWFDQVRELGLWGPGLITDAGARHLARCQAARNLRRLDLKGAALSDDGVRALLDSPWLTSLQRLSLSRDLDLDPETRHELVLRGLVRSR